MNLSKKWSQRIKRDDAVMAAAMALEPSVAFVGLYVCPPGENVHSHVRGLPWDLSEDKWLVALVCHDSDYRLHVHRNNWASGLTEAEAIRRIQNDLAHALQVEIQHAGDVIDMMREAHRLVSMGTAQT